MKSTNDKEYTPPTAARCKEDAERIELEIEAFLNTGGTINKIDSDLKITDAHKRLRPSATLQESAV
jgi:hypothetical protein